MLNSAEHKKLNRSWNIAVKMIWNLPHATHTRLLEDICPVAHLETMLHARYIGFVKSLHCSSKSWLRLLFKNCSQNLGSVTGSNIDYVFRKYSFNTLNQMFDGQSGVKRSKVYELPGEEKWNIPVI